MIQIVDAHQHLWDQSRHRHAWCKGIPLLNRSFLPEEYARVAENVPSGTRLAKAVFVECDADEADLEREAAWACSIAAMDHTLTAGVVAGCRPEHEGFVAYLDRITHPNLRGVRQIGRAHV